MRINRFLPFLGTLPNGFQAVKCGRKVSSAKDRVADRLPLRAKMILQQPMSREVPGVHAWGGMIISMRASSSETPAGVAKVR
jgi:hypothetical protein